MINELTDDRSCIVKAWFNLDEVRIKNFSFRKEIYVGHPLNAYFKVQTINNYNVNERESTEVTLLKLAEYPAWSGGVAPNPPDPFNTELGRIVNGNLGTGSGGQNYGNNSLIAGGSGNYIAVDAENIVLTNCVNVIVERDVTNFTAVGLVGPVVITNTSSNTTLYGADTSITLTSDTTLDISYNNKVVYVDATTANIRITWDSATMTDCKVYLIRADGSANTISIFDTDAAAQFIGNAIPYNLGMLQYDAMPLTYKVDSGGTKQIYIFS